MGRDERYVEMSFFDTLTLSFCAYIWKKFRVGKSYLEYCFDVLAQKFEQFSQKTHALRPRKKNRDQNYPGKVADAYFSLFRTLQANLTNLDRCRREKLSRIV